MKHTRRCLALLLAGLVGACAQGGGGSRAAGERAGTFDAGDAVGAVVKTPRATLSASPAAQISAAVSDRLQGEAELRVIIRYRMGEAPLRLAQAAARRTFSARGEAFKRELVADGIAARRAFVHSPWVSAVLDARGLARLRTDPNVLRVELDPAGAGQLLQAGPLVGLPAVVDAGLSGQGVVVAVLDTGIDSDHPDVADALADEACFCGSGCCSGGTTEASGAGAASDGHGHGTHVSGTIASRGAIAPAGVAAAARIISVKVLDDSNSLYGLSDVVAGLEWVLAAHPETRVVNLSLGTLGAYPDTCDSAEGVAPLAAAADALRAAGIVLVAASGNGASGNGMSAPGCIGSVIGVGAVWDADVGPESIICSEPATSPDLIACFSNSSTTTDLVAPGGRITSSWIAGGARAQVGTSHAAPIVSGCLADMIEASPNATIPALRAALVASPVRLIDSKNGLEYPRLDCADAVARVTPTPDAGGETDSDAGSQAELDAGSDAADAATDTDTGADQADAAGEPPLPGGDTGNRMDGLDPDARPAPDAPGSPGPQPAGAGVGGGVGSAVDVDAGDAGDAGADFDAGAGEHRAGPDAAAGCSCRLGRGAHVEHPRAPIWLLLTLLLCLARMRRRRAATDARTVP